MDDANPVEAKAKPPYLFLSLIAVLLIIIGGVVYIKTKSPPGENMSATTDVSSTGNTPNPESSSNPDSASVKKFDLTAGSFYFTPNKITVNKGDEVTFVIKNTEGFHDLVIDELNVKSDMIKGGETKEVTFKAENAGSFIYYCSVSDHRAKGMWGTLEVK